MAARLLYIVGRQSMIYNNWLSIDYFISFIFRPCLPATIIPQTVSDCRGSGGDSGTGRFLCRQSGRLRSPTFMRRRGTWWMLPRSRADETLGRATFCRKTQWFQHTFLLCPESGPGGLRRIPDPEHSWVPPQGSLKVPPKALLGSFFQNSSSRFPPLRFLKESCLGSPLPGFLPQDSTSWIPP